MNRRIIISLPFIAILLVGLVLACNTQGSTKRLEVGDSVDSMNHVKVCYNGSVDNVLDRNVAADGYNIGLRYQCVEFVKRYYYEFYNHKMPNSYGHAKDFFNKKLEDGAMNKDRNLIQFKNGGKFKPGIGDLIVFDGHSFNPYGHVAIISKVYDDKIEIIQQNPGPNASSRDEFSLSQTGGKFRVESSGVLGWLRKKGTPK